MGLVKGKPVCTVYPPCFHKLLLHGHSFRLYEFIEAITMYGTVQLIIDEQNYCRNAANDF